MLTIQNIRWLLIPWTLPDAALLDKARMKVQVLWWETRQLENDWDIVNEGELTQTRDFKTSASEVIPYVHAKIELNLDKAFGVEHYVALRPGGFATNMLRFKAGVVAGHVPLYTALISNSTASLPMTWVVSVARFWLLAPGMIRRKCISPWLIIWSKGLETQRMTITQSECTMRLGFQMLSCILGGLPPRSQSG